MNEQCAIQKTPITLQEVFDDCWEHFIKKDNKPSMDSRGRCVYESKRKDGIICNCAIGITLKKRRPDVLAKILQDETANRRGILILLGASTDFQYPFIDKNVFDLSTKRLLDTAQSHLHDTLIGYGRLEDGGEAEWEDPKDVREQLYVEFAISHNLKVPK